mgnify:CR=1 FL=1
MISKLHGTPICFKSDGVAFRHFLNMQGRIRFSCGWVVYVEHEMPVEVLTARLADQLGSYCTVKVEWQRSERPV